MQVNRNRSTVKQLVEVFPGGRRTPVVAAGRDEFFVAKLIDHPDLASHFRSISLLNGYDHARPSPEQLFYKSHIKISTRAYRKYRQ